MDFIDSMRRQLGAEADDLFRALQSDAPTSIRLNTKMDVLTFPCDTEEVPWHIDGYYLSERPPFTLDPLFHAGGSPCPDAFGKGVYRFGGRDSLRHRRL